MTYSMPQVDVSTLHTKLDAEQRAIAERVIRNGRLRASAPDGQQEACAHFVWRMVAFLTSPNPKHQCMPVMAECYLWPKEGTTSERAEAARTLAKQLDVIVDAITDCIPKEQWAGVRRWGQVYGMTGTPQYNAEGAVIYR